MAGRECHHCKQWIEEGEAHDCWTTTEAALTADLSEDLHDAWERLRETAADFGEQRIYASGTAIMFSRQACYFFVRPRQQFPAGVRFSRPRRSLAASAPRRTQVSRQSWCTSSTSRIETRWSRRSQTGCGRIRSPGQTESNGVSLKRRNFFAFCEGPSPQRDAVNDWRVGECWTSMGGIVELALRRMPRRRNQSSTTSRTTGAFPSARRRRAELATPGCR